MAWQISILITVQCAIKVLKEIPIGAAVPIRIEGGAKELQRLFLQTNLIWNFWQTQDLYLCMFFSHPERQILFEKGSAPVLGLVGELLNTILCEILSRLVKKTKIWENWPSFLSNVPLKMGEQIANW